MRNGTNSPSKAKRVVWPTLTHRERREGDEIACSCGKRWTCGENHP